MARGVPDARGRPRDARAGADRLGHPFHTPRRYEGVRVASTNIRAK